MKTLFSLTVLLLSLATQVFGEDEVLACDTIDGYWLDLSKPPEKDTEHLSVRTFIKIVDDTLAINYSNGPAEILKRHYNEERADGATAGQRAFIGKTGDYGITVIVLEGDRCQSGDKTLRNATWTSTWADSSFVEMLGCHCDE